MVPGLDLYYSQPAQPLITAGKELDMFIDHDLSVGGVKILLIIGQSGVHD